MVKRQIIQIMFLIPQLKFISPQRLLQLFLIQVSNLFLRIYVSHSIEGHHRYKYWFNNNRKSNWYD
jgi:hypothetical protein